MKKLIKHFIDYPFYANLIIAILLAAGIFSIVSMKMSFFPEQSERNIVVTTVYPGASPKEMEEGITTRIEHAIRGIVGIKEINSTSSENFATVNITTTGEYDIDETLMEVKNAVDAISSFPRDAEKPVVFKRRSISMAIFLGLTGSADLMQLKEYTYRIEDDLRASGMISQIIINGFPATEISVEISEARLLRYNMTFDEVSGAIAGNNLDISGGQLKSDEEEILIRSRYRTVDPKKIEEIVIRANPDGSLVKIQDVAQVKLQFADVSQNAFMNGTRSISIQVMKLPTEDLQSISHFCQDYAKEFNQTHPDAELVITYDFLQMLKARLGLLINNGGIGLFLVLITLGLFLSFRLSLWVAWGIPSSFLAMFILANLYGITINMISLFGMILVIGILVDDGIVIAENIYSHFERGKSARKAALDGTMEVMPAVVTSVTTTIIAFSPLFFLQGRMEFMFEMAFVVVFSLLFSLVEAFFVLPAHLASKHILRQKQRANLGSRLRGQLDRLVRAMRMRLYAPILKTAMNWKYIFIALPASLIIITIGLFGGGFIKATFFPSIPFDQFNVDLAFTPGTGEKVTLEQMRKMDNAIWEVNHDLQDEFKDTVPFINFTFMSTGGAFDGQEQGAHAGNIFVLLRDLENAPVNSYEIVNRVRDKIGNIPSAEKFRVAGRNTFGTPVSVSLLSSDFDELAGAKQMLISRMQDISEINNINDNNATGKQEIRLKLKPKAYFLGLSQAYILNQVRQGFFGGQAQRLQKGKDEVRVWVRYPRQDRLHIGQLENMKIKTPKGDFPLGELAGYSIERGPVNIQHFNGQREARIVADMVDPNEPVPPIMARIRNTIIPDIQANYPSIKVEYQGQSRDSDESQAEMSRFFLIAFLLMILIIMIHFKSVLQALMIIMLIPLGWLGSLWGHGVEGIPVSMLSAWGMVALSGVVINDAVVFLQKYNLNLRNGQKVSQAVYEAALSRFRPIVLTSITTVAGLYPIILEKSFQAQFLVPMATALAYGVLFGTAFILLLFPVIILVVNDFKRACYWLWNGVVPSPESVEPAIKYQARIQEEVTETSTIGQSS